MNIDRLRDVQSRERATDSLQELSEEFYSDVAEFIAERKAAREEAAADAADPFDAPEVGRLSDEIQTAQQVVEAIYQRRVGEIVKQASFAAAEGATEPGGLTAEERTLFHDLIERIAANRQSVLEVVSGEGSPTDAHPPDEPAEPAPAGEPHPETGQADAIPEQRVDPASLMGDREDASGQPPEDSEDESSEDSEGRSPDGSGTEGQSLERTRVQITTDVGEIFGVDERVYTLEADDVVSLPAQNAEPLLEKDAATRL